jgi:head-tail adaptor
MKYLHNSVKITIQQEVPGARDAGGGFSNKTWSTFSQPYGMIEYKKGSEGIRGSRDTELVKGIWRVRYDSDTKTITAKMRILDHDGEVWDIENVIKKGRDELIELHCQKFDR